LSKLFRASVKENEKLAPNHFLITLRPLERILKPKPGQFFMLSVDSSFDPLLKRPFSVHRWLGRDFQLLYRIVGKATEILKQKNPGTVLDLMGPLGNGFQVSGEKSKKILVAGGIGIAPIFSLAELLNGQNPILFLGAQSKDEVLCIDRLKSIGIDPVVSTDDGSLGRKGLITAEVKRFVSDNLSMIADCSVYACGPQPMLRELSLLIKQYELKGYLAVEENMACGLGACLSCVVNTKKGKKRVCADGPVFSADEIIW
jgi:dihydroorotate dehydrogenase electron transfer subunit